MALTPNTLPSNVPDYATPYDAINAFASAQTLTATGFVNNLNLRLDFGGASPSSGAGRTGGMWCTDITAIDFTSGDETYAFALLGSNDSAFGNGNVELLAYHDFAAASAGRVIPTLLGASPAIPPTGIAGTIIKIPFTNLMQRIVYRYAQCRVTIGGTTPSVTVTSWLSFAGQDF
jgi:hypothetical protein